MVLNKVWYSTWISNLGSRSECACWESYILCNKSKFWLHWVGSVGKILKNSFMTMRIVVIVRIISRFSSILKISFLGLILLLNMVNMFIVVTSNIGIIFWPMRIIVDCWWTLIIVITMGWECNFRRDIFEFLVQVFF